MSSEKGFSKNKSNSAKKSPPLENNKKEKKYEFPPLKENE